MESDFPSIRPSTLEVRPIRDEVFIRVIERGGVDPRSGIIEVNDVDNFKPSDRGIVLAVGPGRELETGGKYMPLKPGDKVLYRWRGGDDYTYRGEHHIMIKLDDIFGVLED